MPRGRKVAPSSLQIEMPLVIQDYDGDTAVFPERIGIEELQACAGKRLVFDCETTGLKWWRDKVIGVGVYCPEAGIRGYLPTTNPTMYAEAQRVMQAWPPGTGVMGHNLKFDLHMMRLQPWGCGWDICDTTVALHLVDSGASKALRKGEKRWLGTETKVAFLNEGRNKRGKKVPIHFWPVAQVAKYCTNDCVVTWDLNARLQPLIELLGLKALFQQQMEYLQVVYRIEEEGIWVDRRFCLDAIAQLTPELHELEKELFAKVGHLFDWRSPDQLSKALYDDFGWEKPKNPFEDADGVDRTRFATRGQYNKSRTTGFLLTEKAHHPLGALVLTLREKDRLILTCNQFLDLVDQNDVLHTVYNLTGTRTGRLSSSDPNLQNVPGEIRSRNLVHVTTASELRRQDYQNIRLAMRARPGHMLISIDYKQMEMRMFGILSNDEKMQSSLHAGVDIHSNVARLVWGEVTETNREWSKTIGFGLIYGMSTGSLQFRLNMTRDQAHRVCNQYWTTFPRIKPWLQEIIAECRKNGYVRYWSGRIWRETEEIKMYVGANAVIQGGCADLLSVAVTRVRNKMDELGWGRILLLVHDEAILEVPTERVIEAIRLFVPMMQVPDLMGFSFFGDAKAGSSYGSLHEVPKEIWQDVQDQGRTVQSAESGSGHAASTLSGGEAAGTSGLFGN